MQERYIVLSLVASAVVVLALGSVLPLSTPAGDTPRNALTYEVAGPSNQSFAVETSIAVTRRDGFSAATTNSTRTSFKYDAAQQRVLQSVNSSGIEVTQYREPGAANSGVTRTYVRAQYDDPELYQATVQQASANNASNVATNDTTMTVWQYRVVEQPFVFTASGADSPSARSVRALLFGSSGRSGNQLSPSYDRVGTTQRQGRTVTTYDVENAWRPSSGSGSGVSVMEAEGTVVTSEETGMLEADTTYRIYSGNTLLNWVGAKTGATSSIKIDLDYEATVDENVTVDCPAWTERVGPTPKCAQQET